MVNLIAAGEVIDSLAAVVRELIENALDAQATRITIALFPEIWRVTVTDNGQGMALSDLRNCAKPHTTSKIKHLDDLGKITSLGFRGEALHSLTQVADLSISSRCATEDNNMGWFLHYNAQGEPQSQKPISIAPGSIITVDNLFGKMPVRRQGLPNISSQLKGVQTIIENMALCHPNITCKVLQNERIWLNLSPGKTAQHILPQLLKRIHFNDLQFVEQEVENFPNSKIELLLGLPDRCHRGKADWVKVGINGRIVRSLVLEQTILTAFSRTLPKDRFPVCFIHLQICPSQIDWNRHPAKVEIYLNSLDLWQDKISQIIEKGLILSPHNLSVMAQNERVSKLLKVSEAKGNYQVNSQVSDESGLIELKAVGQVNHTYIVAEHSNGLWLIEQHIAHERVLYENLQDKWELEQIKTPIILTKLSSEQVEQLEKIGLEIDRFGEQNWAIRTVPKLLAKREDCQAALLELSLGGDLQTAQVALACRSAIRNGTEMNLSAMQDLVNKWKNTRNPHTCPHGRPIYLSLEESSLALFFRRHRVIGKSHGI
ncbi:DNA mismatch repair protein MutL [Aphanothece sacrum FPU3]|nr:DNA mismatch repair protein MutL [Aphanothece sacrum FPU3]